MPETTSPITDALNELTNLPEFKAHIARFKEVKWNPFAFKSDGTPEGFAGLIEANQVFSDIMHLAITTVERRCADLKLVLTGEDKLDAVAQFLDDQVKLNALLEPFDKIVFKLLITQGINYLNRTIGQDWINHLPAPSN